MSTYQITAPAVVLIARITRDMAAGKRLEGLKWANKELPSTCTAGFNVNGEDDLPSLQFIDFTHEEKPFAGGRSIPNSEPPAGTNSTKVAGVQNLYLFLSVSREKAGFFNPQGMGVSGAIPGLMDWIGKLLDCINRKDDDGIDGCLNNTCNRPFYAGVKENVPKELSIHAGIEITLYPQAYERGTVTDIMAT